jgi:PAS domain S-box-containing protein
MMPRLDGFELLRRMRSDDRTRDIPLILLSARAGEEARVEGIEAGAADYLVKPFAARELLARVDAHLKRSLEAAEASRARRERELMLEVSQAERTRLQALLEEAPAAIAILRGPAHVFEGVNRRYASIVGSRELLGRPVREALPEVEGQGFFELLDRVYRTGEAVIGDGARMMLSTPDAAGSHEHFFNFVYQPIREDGAVTGVFVHAVDVTDQVRAHRDAEAASRAKSEFLAAMSHELRTPLNAIAGYTQLLDMGVHGPVTAAQREALERVRRSQQHLLALINDVLNFAKLEAGRVEYDITTVDLLEVVNGIRPIIEPQLDAKALAFDVRLASGRLALADRDKLQQILLNLLSNSVKFTGAGGRIAIDSPAAAHVPGAEPTEDVVYLRVTDTGIGIPREKQQLIFEPFVQVNRALTSPTEGTGLGLAISRDLARGMGGDLRVRSEDGQGAAFTISLPRAH